jgi:hypothetical protein
MKMRDMTRNGKKKNRDTKAGRRRLSRQEDHRSRWVRGGLQKVWQNGEREMNGSSLSPCMKVVTTLERTRPIMQWSTSRRAPVWKIMRR